MPGKASQNRTKLFSLTTFIPAYVTLSTAYCKGKISWQKNAGKDKEVMLISAWKIFCWRPCLKVHMMCCTHVLISLFDFSFSYFGSVQKQLF